MLSLLSLPKLRKIDEMIRMVDRDGDGQVGFVEFYRMVTGKPKPPLGLWAGSSLSRRTFASPPPPTGPEVIQARHAKRNALDEFARTHNLKPETIKRAYRRFKSSNLNSANPGLITYAEFCAMIQVDPSPQVNKLFRMYDYNSSDLIDASEILIALANFTGAGKEDKMKFAFLMYDEAGNDVITKAELIKILKANHMARLDAEVARKAETIMAQTSHKEGDGLISFDEFVIVSKKFPNILFPSYDAVRN